MPTVLVGCFYVRHITYLYSTWEKTPRKTDIKSTLNNLKKKKKKGILYAVHFCRVIYKGITWLHKCLHLPVVTFMVNFIIAIAALQPNMRDLL